MQTKEETASNTQVGGDHYVIMNIQPWEAMKAWLTPEEYRGYHKGVILSYIAREHGKGGDTDLKKAYHHFSELMEAINEQRS